MGECPRACERLALVVLSLYAITISVLHARPLNPLCIRDFVNPAAKGSCMCNDYSFCLCTPSLASDVIIELEDEHGRVENVVFIERRDGRGLALVGGFVKVGEASEAAAAREVLEETGLPIRHLRQWCMFSQPARDPRRHTAALVYIARARGTPKAGDDAKGVRIISLHELRTNFQRFAFDHGEIISAYMRANHPQRAGGPIETAGAYDQLCQSHGTAV